MYIQLLSVIATQLQTLQTNTIDISPRLNRGKKEAKWAFQTKLELKSYPKFEKKNVRPLLLSQK